MRYVNGMASRLLVAGVADIIGVGALSAAPDPQSIDASVQRAMEVFNAPGMAVSIVHEGELVHSAGYGDLGIDSSQRVDDGTLFQIGSVSKAFTAAAIAVLADEGRLDWDDPVIDYLPEFRMYDAWVTREFTIRDLLTHRSGRNTPACTATCGMAKYAFHWTTDSCGSTLNGTSRCRGRWSTSSTTRSSPAGQTGG